ncbi:ATP-binding cassette sub-family G member 2-like [Balamuthia mandrillaris]
MTRESTDSSSSDSSIEEEHSHSSTTSTTEDETALPRRTKPSLPSRPTVIYRNKSVGLQFHSVCYDILVKRKKSKKQKQKKSKTEEAGEEDKDGTELRQVGANEKDGGGEEDSSSGKGWLCFGKERKATRRLLDNVSGYVNPGEMLAIMGPSGAGKTTLLDALAGRLKAGEVKGSICFNGRTPDPAFYRTVTYVQQEDIFMGTATVEETLFYAAMLRLPPTMPYAQKKAVIEDIVDELDMRRCFKSKVGDDVLRGISGGEKKRLSVAVGLLTDPGLIFLDEPTTGLDSSISMSLAQTLKNLTEKKGRTVICTIHQPRFEIFQKFDKLLLLSQGKTVYFGAANKAVDYFASLGFKCPRFRNPPDYFLDVIKREEKKGSTLLVDAYENSSYNENLVKYLASQLPVPQAHTKRWHHWRSKSKLTASETHIRSSDDSTKPEKSKEKEIIENTKPVGEDGGSSSEYNEEAKGGIGMYMLKFFLQVGVLLLRALRNNYRDPLFFFTEVGQALVIGLFLSISFFRMDDDLSGIQDKLGALFFSVLILIFVSLFSVLAIYPRERAVFNRERANGMYSTFSFFLATSISTLPVQVANSALYSVVTYWTFGLRTDGFHHFLIYFATLLLLAIVAESLGFAIGALIPNFQITNLLASLAFLVWMLSTGFLVSNGNQRPWYEWVGSISFPRYAFDILCINEFEGRDLDCETEEGDCDLVAGQEFVYNGTTVDPSTLGLQCEPLCTYPTGDDLLAQSEFDKLSIGVNFILMLVMLFLFRLIQFLVLRFVKVGKA